jgi:AraC-like DNA-binding protein
MLIVRPPAPPLRQRVESLWYFTSAGASRRERALPSGTAQVIVNLHRDRVRWYDGANYEATHALPGTIVAGPSVRHVGIDTEDQIETIGASLRPGGAARLFGVPVGELRDRHVPLLDLWGRDALQLRERLLTARTPQEKLAVLEAALLARSEQALDPAIAYAVDRLAAPEAKVRDVFDRIGWSPSRFSRSFTDAVGITPKAFARVRRFQAALARIRRPPAVSLGELAAACGYFDHAHFVHDFHAFAGLTPSAYLAAGPEHTNHVPLV